MSSPPMKTGIAPSFTWGSSARLLSTSGNLSASAQLAQVSLPEPAVCSIYIQSQVIRASSTGNALKVFTINLLQGVGRVTIPRQMSFAFQPSSGAPLELTIPFVPLHALQVNVEQAAAYLGTDQVIETETYLVLSPMTRIPDDGGIQFGMALPGEADSLDDELLAELEEDAPSVQEILNPAPVEVMSKPGSIVARIIADLTEHYGRPPTRLEAQDAIEKFQRRQDRRRRRIR